ncbi:hypothetical protein CASFOL_020216 [Castilleja foliolosa]|uniref:mRNA export factor GLE1 n=1 Tax=Castilleja foliolosa TaxID=1961234 RepID=A0ABD3D1I6_9LAMI
MLVHKGLKRPGFLKTGHNIVELVFQLIDCVILGAGTRATEGPIVTDKNCEKIHYMAANIYCCGAGTAADTEAVTDMVGLQQKLHLYHTGRESRVGLAEVALHELYDGFQLTISEDLRSEIFSLESHLIYEHEDVSYSRTRIQKYRELRLENERQLDLQYKRTIAEALDNHLTAVQRDHEQISQLAERKIRDDAAREEEAKGKQVQLVERKIRDDAAREEEAKTKKACAEISSYSAEALDNHLTAVQRDHEQISQLVGRKIRDDATREEEAKRKQVQSPGKSLTRASENALKLEKQRSQIYGELSADLSFKESANQDYIRHGHNIGRQIKTISATIENVRTRAEELVKLISDPRLPQSISIQLFAKKMASCCTNQRSSNAIFATSRVIVMVTSKIPLAMDILIAELNRVCIYTVPKHIVYSQEVYRTKDSYLKAIGYTEENGRIWSTDDYIERLSSYMRLYGALVQAEVPGFQNLHGLKEGWSWLARFLNAVPANLYSAVALYSFLEMAGYALYQRYRNQFEKLVGIVARDFLSALKEGGSESRFKMSIQSYIESNQFKKEPEGLQLRGHLLSSHVF